MQTLDQQMLAYVKSGREKEDMATGLRLTNLGWPVQNFGPGVLNGLYDELSL